MFNKIKDKNMKIKSWMQYLFNRELPYWMVVFYYVFFLPARIILIPFNLGTKLFNIIGKD
ncbi:MAG: hypothetical protein GX660_25540 [Clostridiaceae bacterium]|nr:hypothetical protein [Clostridiaceae bacterium]